jgi:hypothetical protein
VHRPPSADETAQRSLICRELGDQLQSYRLPFVYVSGVDLSRAKLGNALLYSADVTRAVPAEARPDRDRPHHRHPFDRRPITCAQLDGAKLPDDLPGR